MTKRIEDGGWIGTMTYLARNVVTDKDLLVIEQHAVDSTDGSISSFSSLIMDETVALGVAVLVGGDLAREDVAEGSERVVQSLVIS